eukprot:12817305-Alexandrium_andersonii.AAC.1
MSAPAYHLRRERRRSGARRNTAANGRTDMTTGERRQRPRHRARHRGHARHAHHRRTRTWTP